jgi:UDP-N-acetylglucosamine diphosphorylase/glucosamine-1-phosphate N-acetyltransferase
MGSTLCLFEDSGWKNLLPLTYLRPVSELRCGSFTLRGRIERVLGVEHLKILSRDYLSSGSENAHTVELTEGSTYINARLLTFSKERLLSLGKGEMLLRGDDVVAFNPASTLRTEIPFSEEFLTAAKRESKAHEVDFQLVTRPWHIVVANPAMLANDFPLLESGIAGSIGPAVLLHGDKKALSLGRDSRIEDFSVLSLERGPVFIGENVTIRGHTTIEGPCYIGDGSVVESARLRESSFGPQCRLSGEIEASVFQGYSNKRHEGFLGHSVLGEWINLGAGTTNSDLKNNYGHVRVALGGTPVSSGISKLGCFVGDHSKTGIGTLINTGAVFGVFSNLLGGKVSPKYLPSFSWDTGDGFTEYELEKALQTAGIVMKRRGKELTPRIEAAVREVFRITAPERSAYPR